MLLFVFAVREALTMLREGELTNLATALELLAVDGVRLTEEPAILFGEETERDEISERDETGLAVAAIGAEERLALLVVEIRLLSKYLAFDATLTLRDENED